MLAQPKNILISIGVLLLAVSACQGPPPAPTAADPDYPSTLTAIAQTLSAGTAPVTVTAEIVSSTLSTEAIPTATDLPSTIATDAPPILTATFTAIPSPSVPMVSVTKGTNCRSGPGRVYDLIGGAEVGARFVLVGKSSATNYWIMRLPDGRECWLWGEYAVVEGNVNSLPEYAVPPTPLPLFGSVAGTITDSLGNPVSNVTVSALVAEKTFTTGTNGKYSFGDLPAGTEFISVSAAAFASVSRSVNVSPGSVFTADFVVVPDLPATGTPTPSTQAVVEGVVLINGAPAAGANVWVLDRTLQATTDSNGRYAFFLGQGSFRILAQLGNARGGVEVFLPADQTTRAPDIILLPR